MQYAVGVKCRCRRSATRLISLISIVRLTSSFPARPTATLRFTATIRRKLRGRSINVNAVAPGPTATDLFLVGKSQDLIDRFAKMNPLERLGTPEDIAAAVAFLVGPDGSWINGQVLRTNGGMV